MNVQEAQLVLQLFGIEVADVLSKVGAIGRKRGYHARAQTLHKGHGQRFILCHVKPASHVAKEGKPLIVSATARE